ncbi:MFS transporter [Sansalvadorimonas sp. 2012CJ34-2]|uniref:MFS transporter n=1 Tax=Parendozoicomonas callyspongiae TaxID=2942213 RepID=A0ABT0PJA8_9GAMM|nr:MFS transporter [Sansalvadorimonas sp. 2012CJ34-2]MCL6271321.1 MFS transporter [Sansalvadorimonas sp. 2012CJ34-2]
MNVLLSNRNYRHLFFAQITSLAGTGISTIALALLAYNLAGDRAGSVLGTALALKMFAYVILAPVIGAFAHKLPRKQWLAGLDLVRAGLILLLPFVSEIWHIYLLILAINSCSAGFTPVYQSVLPQVLPDKQQYMKALSWSRLAYDLEQLLSPTLAGLLLTVMSFRGLFIADAITFLLSGALIITAVIPAALQPERKKSIIHNLQFGIRSYLKTPRLRAVLGAYMAVASASAMAIVNTVIYVSEALNKSEQETAMAMAAMGFGSMLIALNLPRWLKKHEIRSVILTGCIMIVAALAVGISLPSWSVFLLLWFVLGMGTSLIQTPVGALINRSCRESDSPAFFAANFSLSHLCWFFTYLLAGWGSATLGLTHAFMMMTALSLAGLLVALKTYPKHDPEELEHAHPGNDGEPETVHSHHFVIDIDHPEWPVKP